MRTMTRWIVSLALITGLVMLGSLSAWAVTTYDITDLGVISPGPLEYSQGVSLNDLGQATGYSLYDAGGGQTYAHAFRWNLTSTPQMENLPGFGGIMGTPSYGTRINNAGTVVGYAENGAGLMEAAVWVAGQTDPIPLGRLSASHGPSWAYDSVALGVNDAGLVVGQSWDGVTIRGFVWSSGNGMSALPMLDGTGGFTQAYAVNNAGSTVGQSWDGSMYRAFLYTGGSMKGLPTINSWDSEGGKRASEAFAVNSAGLIGGYSWTGTDDHACYWDGVGAPVDIGTLNDASGSSYVWGINDDGAMVGYSRWAGDYIHAYVYEDEVMYDLNSLIPGGSGWELQAAYDINASGQIVGTGLVDGVQHAYLLTETPELSSSALLLLGGLPLGLAWWRRRRVA